MERRDKDEETPLAVPIPSFGRGGGPRRAAPRRGPTFPGCRETRRNFLLSSPHPARARPAAIRSPKRRRKQPLLSIKKSFHRRAAYDEWSRRPHHPGSLRSLAFVLAPPHRSGAAGRRAPGARGRGASPPPQKILGAPGTAGRGLDSRGISWTRRGFVAVRRAGRAASCGAAGPAQRDRVLVPPGALSGRARAFCATAGLLRAAASSCNLLVCV
jgi:hypothetical protein